MIDLINEILATLRHNKVRTALTGFAVSWGIFLLIVLLSVSHGLVNGMNAMFSSRDTESIRVSGGWANKPFKGLTDNRQVQLREKDMQLIANRNPESVNNVSAQIENNSAVISTGKDYITGGYTGVYPSGLKDEGGKLAAGRFVNDNDIRQGRRVVVLHKDNARNLFGEHSDPVGQLVKINDLSFTVIGVYTHEWNTGSFIPYTTARNMAGGSDIVNRMTVSVQGLTTIEDGNEVENEIYNALGNEHSFDPSDKSALWVWNRFNDHLRQSAATGAMDIAVWIIGMLTMLSGIVGVSNIMFVSVRERTHEIGVRRAIGARPFSILKQIILESVAITTLFGYVGIVLGVAVAGLIGYICDKGNVTVILNPTVNLTVALEVTVVLVIAGALAGLFPALKSLKIKPVEALRDE
ncbi:MAG: ABC transporter permease [Duncaniella sp.]|nr:ABC transporter permease [Duncaniella sp.]